VETGSLPYEGYTNVAALVIDRVDPGLLENAMVRRIFDSYYEYLNTNGVNPEISYFINFPDAAIQQRMASLLQTRDEISHNWKDIYGIETLHEVADYLNDVDSTLSYFEFKKILIMQELLTKKILEEKDPIRQTLLQKKYIELKQTERDIVKKHGTVTFKVGRIR